MTLKHVLMMFALANLASCAAESPDEEVSPASSPGTVLPLPAAGKADSLGAPPPCSQDLDCAIGQACHDGECFVASCRTGASCANHEVCVQDRCTIAWCEADQSCAAGESCIAGKCIASSASCIDGLDCTPEEACILSLCVNPACDSDADCHDSVCVGGACRRLDCVADRDCADAEVCRDGRCTVDE